jgi:hypothetical protein
MDPSKATTRSAAALVARSEMAAGCLNERTKCEPSCQFCVSWHTLSWSVPAEIAEMAETGSQMKTWICADFVGLSRENAGAARRDPPSAPPLHVALPRADHFIPSDHSGYRVTILALPRRYSRPAASGAKWSFAFCDRRIAVIRQCKECLSALQLSEMLNQQFGENSDFPCGVLTGRADDEQAARRDRIARHDRNKGAGI